MQAVFNHLEFRLGAQEGFALDHAAAAAIRVIKGNVWITQDGMAADHVVGAGQSFKVDGNAGLWLSALSPARLSIDAARHPPALPRRLLRRAQAWYLRIHRLGARWMARQRSPVAVI